MSIQNVRLQQPKPQKKTSILVAILTGFERHHWLHPDLLHVCLNMIRWQQETGSNVAFTNIHGKVPVDAARNIAVKQALDMGVDWLLQIDNDVVPRHNILAVLQDIGNRKIVGMPCPMEYRNGAPPCWCVAERRDNDFFELKAFIPQGWSQVQLVGSGCILVHRDVFLSLDDPWFECPREYIIRQRQHAIEDFTFCEKASAKGFSIWTHSGFACRHYHTVDLLQMMESIPQALAAYHDALTLKFGGPVPFPGELEGFSVHPQSNKK